ncbi:MAG: O-antigen ligase family protein, partial [Prevotellaceae bacterium]|nr:O-antigen ligase family protein [Prevotellaceae bacterium]
MKLNKCQIIYKIPNILFLIILLLVLCTVFIVNSDYVYSMIAGKYFWFYGSVTLLSVIAIPAFVIKRRKRLRFEIPDLLILLFCIAAVLITFSCTNRLTNKCMLLGFSTAVYFYLRIFFSGQNKLIYSLCGMAFVTVGLVEAVWGLMQVYGLTVSQHNLYKITGSFFNPGPYSGWLATVFPMALGYAVFNRKEHKVTQSLFGRISKTGTKIIGLLTVLCTLLVLPAAMSRASWLAALGGSIFIAVMYGLQNKAVIDRLKKYRKRLVLLSIAVSVLFAVAMTGLFLLKKDSASGRAFTWKIALQTVKEHPFGVGLGNFGGSYGDAQAAYFASGAGTEREEYVAGGVEYAFNEYLQICIETGIVPFLIFLAFVFRVLYSGIRNRNYLPAGSLAALLIFASMSYPFNVLPFVITFVFLSVLCMADGNDSEIPDRKRLYPKFVIWAFLIIAPVSIALCTDKICSLQAAHKKWSRTRALYVMNMYR